MVIKTTGKLIYSTGEKSDKGDLFIPPHVFEITKDDILMTEEMFGPILPIITVDSREDAIKHVRGGEKPLSAYIFTQNEKSAEEFLNKVLSGHSMVNNVVSHLSGKTTYSVNNIANFKTCLKFHYYNNILLLTVKSLPFGGVGHSGMGRRHGKYEFDSLTHEKAVVIRY